MGIKSYITIIAIGFLKPDFSFSRSYKELDTDVFHNKDKTAGEVITPFYYTVLNQSEENKISIDTKSTHKNKCFLTYISANRLKYSTNLKEKALSLPKSHQELSNHMFKYGGIDTIFIHNQKEKKLETLLYGVKGIYSTISLNGGKNLSEAIEEFCLSLNYNAVVLSVDKNIAKIAASNFTYNTEEKAVVYGKDRKTPSVKIQNTSNEASSLLNFVSKDDRYYYYKSVIGNIS